MHIFKNFKNFADVEIDLSKPMTLLIGRNGSGKSNLIEGVELLAYLMSVFNKPNEISDLGRGGRFEIRGGLNGCTRHSSECFIVGYKDKIKFYFSETESIPRPHEIEDDYSCLIEVRLNNTKIEIITKKNTNNSNFLLLHNEHSTEFELHQKYSNVFAFDIYPRAMRQYSSIGLNELTKNGFNISSVLYSLHQNKSETLNHILEKIRQLPEEAFECFDFITTSDNSDVLFALKYPNGETISAKLLSDGTLRALAILTALETVPEGSRIIIEEIDNGVHASRVNVLIDAIWEASNRRKLNTLITTHNPATLDSLTDEQLECVVVCHY